MIHGKQDINIPGFADQLTVIECHTHGELFGILINDVRNLTEDCGSLPGCCLFPGGEGFPYALQPHLLQLPQFQTAFHHSTGCTQGWYVHRKRHRKKAIDIKLIRGLERCHK